MTTSTRLEWSRPGPDGRHGTNAGLNGARRQRRRSQFSLLAAGVVLLGLSAAVFAALVPRTPHARPVLVAARTIRAGQSIGAGDLRVAEVASSGVNGVGVGSRAAVVGRVAAFDVAAGQPLVAADVGGAPGPAAGDAIVGVALTPGRLPAGLSVGDSVVVLATAAPAGAAGPAVAAAPGATVTAELARARVFALSPSPDGSRMDVSLVVPSGSADAVADAAASDRVSLYWVAR